MRSGQGKRQYVPCISRSEYLRVHLGWITADDHVLAVRLDAQAFVARFGFVEWQHSRVKVLFCSLQRSRIPLNLQRMPSHQARYRNQSRLKSSHRILYECAGMVSLSKSALLKQTRN